MESIEELRREAEEAKEKVRRDILEFRDILHKLAEHASYAGKARSETAMHRVEKRIEETANRVESRIEKAMSAMTGAVGSAGKTITREQDFADFTNVEINCCFKADIRQAPQFSVSLTGKEDLLDYVSVDKSGSTLKVSVKPLRLRARPDLVIRITMPSLKKLRLRASATCKVCGFASEDPLDLNLSGASELDVSAQAGPTRVEISGASRLKGCLTVGDAEFVLSGASEAELKGSAGNSVLNAWGASRLGLSSFALGDTSVQLKGASRAVINVAGKLDLDLSGGSRLSYSGNPTMGDVKVTGASTLAQR